MEREFANYEQSLALKELGFDEECFSFYGKDGSCAEFAYYDLDRENSTMNSDYMDGEKDCTAPLIQQAFRFFREKYGLYAEILVDQTMEPKLTYRINKYEKDFEWSEPFIAEFLYRTYEEAEQSCLDKLIELAAAQRKQEQYIALTDLMKADEADGLYDLDI